MNAAPPLPHIETEFLHHLPIPPALQNSQKEIPRTIEYDMYGSKEFFEAFRNFRFPKKAGRKQKINLYNHMRYIYYQIPLNVRTAIKKNQMQRFFYSFFRYGLDAMHLRKRK